MKNLIVAHSNGGVIGNKGKIPWAGDMPADMQHFKTLTMGHPVIMGRLTFDSLKKPLNGRQNIVVSRSVLYLAGCDVVRDLEEAYALTDGEDETFVIGGAQIYRAALPTTERLYVTSINAQLPGDAFFDIDPTTEGFNITSLEGFQADDRNKYPYHFVTYERTSNE